MSEYEEAFESALISEEQVVEAAESENGRSQMEHFSVYVSFYITAISLVVAIAALGTAFAADDWMGETLTGLAERMDFSSLQLQARCHEIQEELASLAGHPPDATRQRQIDEIRKELAAISTARARAEQTSVIADKAHYVLAVGVTLLQIATALAAVMGITKHQHLLYASAVFASGGVYMTILGLMKFIG